jgi:hypothetical protein
MVTNQPDHRPAAAHHQPQPQPASFVPPARGRGDSLEDIIREFNHCGPDLQSIREVKTRADHRIRELLAQLDREKKGQDEDYGRRMDKLRNDERLKSDALQAQMARLAEEKAAADRLFADRIQQALAEQSEQENAFQDRLLHIDQFERQRYEDLRQKVQHLQDDWAHREQEYLHRIELIRREMQEQHRLHQERVAQMLGDDQYKEEPQRQRQELQREWRSVEGRITGQLSLIQEEKAQQDHLYEQTMTRLRSDLQRLRAELSEELDHLEREKAGHYRMIDNRIAAVTEEKRRQEELYELAQEQERVKREYHARGSRPGDSPLASESNGQPLGGH